MNTTVALLVPDAAPFFYYGRGAVSEAEAADLIDFLSTVPTRSIDNCDPRREFAFVAHTDRAEAAGGDPIWLGSEWGAGVEMPSPVALLRDRIVEIAWSVPFADRLGFEPDLRFSSVYVDRYTVGGGFSPHTDGEDAYGPLIAGASIGPGSARFGLWDGEAAGPPPRISFALEPNSVYFFAGPIRAAPWRHGVAGVTDLRYGITFRTRPTAG